MVASKVVYLAEDMKGSLGKVALKVGKSLRV